MTITLNFTDGGTGQTAGPSGPATLLIGTAAMNTGYSVGNIYAIGSNDDIRAILKNGPLAAYAAQALALAGPTIYVYAVAGTAGANSAVTQTGTGTVMTVTGTAIDSYGLLLRCTTAGTVGSTAKVQASLDNGYTWGNDFTANTTDTALNDPYGNSSGISVKWAAGDLVLGTTWLANCMPKYVGSGAIDAALKAAALDGTKQWRFVQVVGAASEQVADATNATTQAGVATQLATSCIDSYFKTRGKFLSSLCEGPDNLARGNQDATFDTAVFAAFAAVVASSGCVYMSHGAIEVNDPISQLRCRRSVAILHGALISQKIAQSKEFESLSWVGGTGALPGCLRAFRDDLTATVKASSNRAISVQTYPYYQGYYSSVPKTLAASNSDYKKVGRSLVATAIATTAYVASVPLQSQPFTGKPNGSLTEESAVRIENTIAAAILDRYARHISPPTKSLPLVVVDRTNNVATTDEVKYIVQLIPLLEADTITISLGYVVQR